MFIDSDSYSDQLMFQADLLETAFIYYSFEVHFEGNGCLVYVSVFSSRGNAAFMHPQSV